MALKKSELYSSLWSSCDELRGGMDASQYKDYVLVLLFIKYVSDKYAGQPYAPITIPPGASFKDMVALKGKPDIGDQINKKVIAPLASANKLSDFPDFADAAKLGSGKKHQIKQGAMQELLTGKKRLPGFGGEWTVKRIEKVAFPSSDKNVSRAHLPVLTCSKHLGFVDSLAYFKNQVFSRDTSGYKIVRRGQIGYPSNHVEEGSIGLQDLYDVALVSPIYVVFSVVDDVDSYFLHRLLKLDSYRQAFATATSSSVDRRGSLRWPAFSQITVNLPRFEEQTAVAEVLRDMEAETTALEAKVAKVRQLKHSMMQELLTGRIRLT